MHVCELIHYENKQERILQGIRLLAMKEDSKWNVRWLFEGAFSAILAMANTWRCVCCTGVMWCRKTSTLRSPQSSTSDQSSSSIGVPQDSRLGYLRDLVWQHIVCHFVSKFPWVRMDWWRIVGLKKTDLALLFPGSDRRRSSLRDEGRRKGELSGKMNGREVFVMINHP